MGFEYRLLDPIGFGFGFVCFESGLGIEYIEHGFPRVKTKKTALLIGACCPEAQLL